MYGKALTLEEEEIKRQRQGSGSGRGGSHRGTAGLRSWKKSNMLGRRAYCEAMEWVAGVCHRHANRSSFLRTGHV